MSEIFIFPKLVINKAKPKTAVRQAACSVNLPHTLEGLPLITQNMSKESPLSLPEINNLLLLGNCNGQWRAAARIKISLHKNLPLHLLPATLPKTVTDSVSVVGPGEFAHLKTSHRMLILPVRIPHWG